MTNTKVRPWFNGTGRRSALINVPHTHSELAAHNEAISSNMHDPPLLLHEQNTADNIAINVADFNTFCEIPHKG